jgi:hypothetical protein
MKIVTISACLSLIMAFSSAIAAQNLTASLRVGMDYNETYLVVNNILGTSNIGDFTSIWGYRAGIALDAKVYKAFSLDTELGYSQGGFEGGYKQAYRKNINQIYLSIAPQYDVLKFLKIKGGLLLNYNIKSKSSDFILNNVEPLNYGLTGGITGSFDWFEVGFRYTHHLNYYYSFKKRDPIFDDGYQYWNIYSFFMGFKLWKSTK